MLSQKIAQQSLRRFAAHQPYAMRWAVMNSVSPVTIATGRSMQVRRTASSAAAADHSKLLAEQRLNRPVSPHLSIYRPQITWYLSGLNRITGLLLSGTMYLFFPAYLVAPLLGWHLESASLAAAFAALPVLAKFSIKAFFALPFTFHSFNGLRHLTWDLGRAINNQAVIKSGWTVVGLSVISALALAFM